MYRQRSFLPILIVLIFSIIAAIASGAAVYYYSIGKTQVEQKQKEEEKEKIEKELEDLKKEYEKLKAENEQLKGSEEAETSDWKTYSSSKYGVSIKYPRNWVYKDYGQMVAFADKTSNLPAEDSDQPAIISISTASQAITASSLSQCPNNAKKETITLSSDISAAKWTTLGNCAEDMFGDAKIITIEVKKSSAKYIHIENFNDEQKSIFEKMLPTFKLI